jgi:carbamate kinase
VIASGLTVVAVGGNALSPPRGSLSLSAEREATAAATAEIARLASGGGRLLVVHGNGPQVGRLLAASAQGDSSHLDVLVAQSQGELGYLLAQGLDAHRGAGAERCVALVTRVVVSASDPAFADPDKPVGPTLTSRPVGVPARPVPGGGWRRVVASPRALEVVEREAIATLLARHHVVAGGGGGVPVAGDAGQVVRPVPAVVDKDRVAGLLAIALGARELIFVTDVDGAYDRYGGATPSRIGAMSPRSARARLAAGVFGPGSMAPKVESAVDFFEATGRRAVITAPGAIETAIRGAAGTTVAA